MSDISHLSRSDSACVDTVVACLAMRLKTPDLQRMPIETRFKVVSNLSVTMIRTQREFQTVWVSKSLQLQSNALLCSSILEFVSVRLKTRSPCASLAADCAASIQNWWKLSIPRESRLNSMIAYESLFFLRWVKNVQTGHSKGKNILNMGKNVFTLRIQFLET